MQSQCVADVQGFFRDVSQSDSPISNVDDQPTASSESVQTVRPETSTVFFHDRMCDAFPGVTGHRVFGELPEALARLRTLLAPPLEFHGYPPIWEIAHGQSHITHASVDEINGILLLGHHRYAIEHIEAYRSVAPLARFRLTEVEGRLAYRTLRASAC